MQGKDVSRHIPRGVVAVVALDRFRCAIGTPMAMDVVCIGRANVDRKWFVLIAICVLLEATRDRLMFRWQRRQWPHFRAMYEHGYGSLGVSVSCPPPMLLSSQMMLNWLPSRLLPWLMRRRKRIMRIRQIKTNKYEIKLNYGNEIKKKKCAEKQANSVTSVHRGATWTNYDLVYVTHACLFRFTWLLMHQIGRSESENIPTVHNHFLLQSTIKVFQKQNPHNLRCPQMSVNYLLINIVGTLWGQPNPNSIRWPSDFIFTNFRIDWQNTQHTHTVATLDIKTFAHNSLLSSLGTATAVLPRLVLLMSA